MDKDYGGLIYRDRLSHAGLIRMPHGPTNERLGYIREVLARHGDELAGAHRDRGGPADQADPAGWAGRR